VAVVSRIGLRRRPVHPACPMATSTKNIEEGPGADPVRLPEA
jgi:hypothetical protein